MYAQSTSGETVPPGPGRIEGRTFAGGGGRRNCGRTRSSFNVTRTHKFSTISSETVRKSIEAEFQAFIMQIDMVDLNASFRTVSSEMVLKNEALDRGRASPQAARWVDLGAMGP